MEIILIIKFFHIFHFIIGLDVYFIDLSRVGHFEITILAEVLILNLDMNGHKWFGDTTKLGRFYLIDHLVVDYIDWCASNFYLRTKYLCRLTCHAITILNVFLCVLLLGLFFFVLLLITSCHWYLLCTRVIIFLLIQAFQGLSINDLHHLLDFMVIFIFYFHILDIIVWMGKLQAIIAQSKLLTVFQ